MTKPVNSCVHQQQKIKSKKMKIKTKKCMTKKIIMGLSKLPTEVLKIIWDYTNQSTRHYILYPKFKNFISQYLNLHKIYDDSYRDISINNNFNIMTIIKEIPINKITQFMNNGTPEVTYIETSGGYMNLNQYIYRMRRFRNTSKKYFRLSSYSRLVFLIEILCSDVKKGRVDLIDITMSIIYAVKYIHEKFAI